MAVLLASTLGKPSAMHTSSGFFIRWSEGVMLLKIAGKLFLVLSIVLIAFFLWLRGDSYPNVLWELGKDSTSQTEEKEKLIHITRQDGSELTLPLEIYLEGVIGSEMPASFEMEALKAQCVAARTFVTKREFAVDDTTSTQVFYDDEQLHQIWGTQYDTNHERIVKALKDTEGEIMTYQGEIITAAFFSSSCGKTANGEEYWDSESPYLKSVDSPWDKQEDGYEKTVIISEEDFHTKLGFANPVQEIEKPQYYASGYVKSILIDRVSFTGREVREKLNLRSSCFSIKKVDQGYAITTKGYGHGLGMSQYGAQGMALEGYDYEAILKHYYTGIEIVKE